MYASLGQTHPDKYFEDLLAEAPGAMNFTMFLTMFGEKLQGTDPEDVIKNAFGCFDENNTGNEQIIFYLWQMLFFSIITFKNNFFINQSKIKYLAFFITFCFVVSLAKMVTLTNNIVYKKSAQYRKYI